MRDRGVLVRTILLFFIIIFSSKISYDMRQRAYDEGYQDGYHIGLTERPLINEGFEVTQIVKELMVLTGNPIPLEVFLEGSVEHPTIMQMQFYYPKEHIFHFVAVNRGTREPIIPYFNTTEPAVTITIHIEAPVTVGIGFLFEAEGGDMRNIRIFYRLFIARWREIQECYEVPIPQGHIVEGYVREKDGFL